MEDRRGDIILSDYTDMTDFRVNASGPFALLYAPSPAAVGAAWDSLHAKAEGRFDIYRRDQTPLGWHYRGNPRVGDLVIMALDDSTVRRVRPEKPDTHKGQHADDPAFTFTAAGTEKIGEVDAAILDISGAVPWVRWYIDPKTGYILREKYKAMGQSGPFDGESNLSDWRTVDGLTMPYKHQNKQNGQETSNAEFKKIDINPAVDPKLFAKPAENAAEKENK